jgi:hypothetical protein
MIWDSCLRRRLPKMCRERTGNPEILLLRFELVG